MTSWASPTDGSSAAATPGMRLGERYELTRPIASGGMAQVWSAHDMVLDRVVAIKILHPHLATDEGFIERFRREAVAAASLSHSCIVSIYDTISENGLEAIVMELIEGRTLRAVLDEVGAMPALDVLHFGIEISGALDEAHKAGIVHRDIKPANIMICPDRRVMVTDFGIAKALSDADLTQTGTLLGTAKYLAPEQVTGEPIDPRSDLYALGVVMFEALTGNAPFRANTDAATALARLHQDPPPVRSLRPNVSRELAAVVERLMERDPSRRYARAEMLRGVLMGIDSATGDPNGEVSRAGQQPSRPVPPMPPGATVAASPAGPVGPPTPAHPAQPAHPPQPPQRLGSGARSDGGPSTTGPAVTGPPVGQPLGDPAHGPSQAPPPSFVPSEFELIGVDHAVVVASTVSDSHVVRSGRSRAVPLIVIGLVVCGLVVGGVLLTDVETRMGIGDEVPSNPLDEGGPGLAIVDVRSFDPQTLDENKEEREEITSLAADGDLSTAWTTEVYRRRQLGGLKDGVGLMIELHESLPLNRIELDTNTEGWEAEIYVGDGFADDGSDWGPPVAVVDAGSNRVVRELDRTEGKVVLLWIRDTGLSGERFRFELAEVVVR